jgi:BolA protein
MPNTSQNIGSQIENLLAQALNLAHLEVINESANHNVPAGSQSHFKLVLVTEDFTGMPRIARHRRINTLLREFLAGPVHALAMHTYTEQEWQQRFGATPMSPPCLGGGQDSGPESIPGVAPEDTK